MNACTHIKYLDDKFCATCGIEVAESIAFKGLSELAPEVLTKLKKDYPDAKTRTGRLEEVYIYRTYMKSSSYSKSGNDTKTITHEEYHSYLWIRLIDEQGEVFEGNISAEDDDAVKLKKGDVITVVFLSPLYVNYKFEKRSDKHIVKNNLLGSAVVIHGKTYNTFNIDEYYNPPAKKTALLWFIAPCIIFLLGATFTPSAGGVVWSLVILSAIVGAYAEIKRNKTIYQKGVDKFNRLTTSFEAFLSISYKELGYDQPVRQKQDSDSICLNCESRTSTNDPFCAQCGHTQEKNDQHATLSSDQREVVTSLTLKEAEQAFRQEFSTEYSAPFSYTNLLSRNYRADVTHRCYLAKIIEISNSAAVSEGSIQTDKTTTYDVVNADTRAHIRTETHTNTVIEHNRHSDIYGEINIDCGSGATQSFLADLTQLNHCNIGDWLFFSEAEFNAKTTRDSHEFGFYNISTDKAFDNNKPDFSIFTDRDGTILTTLFIIAVAACFYFDVSAYKSIIPYLHQIHPDLASAPEFVPLVLFGFVFVATNLYNFIFRAIDRRKFRTGRRRIINLRNKLQKNGEEIRQRINKWR